LKATHPSAYSGVAPSTLTPAEPRHKPELDGIRGIAIIAVMLSHGGPLVYPSGLISKLLVSAMIPGWSGVELFFTLSGFLITGILLRTKHAENYFSSFYMRRFLRISPIYYFTLTVILILAAHSSWWNSMLPEAGRTRLSYYFYLQNWPMSWPHGIELRANVIGHFWSLAVEEQFYLIWPLLVLLLPEAGLFWLCSLFLGSAIVFRIVFFHKVGGDYGFIHLLPTRVDGLLVGAMCAILSRWRGRVPLRLVYSALAIGGGIIGYIALFHHHELIGTYRYMETVGYTGFALLSGGLIGLSQYPRPILLKFLRMRWLTETGKYSYGIYVYHIPIYAICDRFVATRLGLSMPAPLHLAIPYVALMIACSFLVAKISYDFFESKILALKVHFKPRFPRP
jgi:peptidoglycan/LPS O-acetylase OafA/YrhL